MTVQQDTNTLGTADVMELRRRAEARWPDNSVWWPVVVLCDSWLALVARCEELEKEVMILRESVRGCECPSRTRCDRCLLPLGYGAHGPGFCIPAALAASGPDTPPLTEARVCLNDPDAEDEPTSRANGPTSGASGVGNDPEPKLAEPDVFGPSPGGSFPVASGQAGMLSEGNEEGASGSTSLAGPDAPEDA